MSTKKYDPADEHDPLPFEIPTAGGASDGSRRTYAKSVEFGLCPSHVGDGTGRGTGLVRQGEHLAWRVHHIRTFGGATLICPSSGQPVCTSPSQSKERVACPCGATNEQEAAS